MKQGWEYKKLGEVATFVADGDWIESKDQSDNGIRLIQTGNVGNGCFKAKEDKPHFISEDTMSKLGCTEIYEGDCLVSRLPDPVGRACLVPNVGCRMITAVDCSIIRFGNNYLPQFFVDYSQSSKYRNSINNNTTGTTRKRISRKNLEKILVPFPTLSEQESIVSELDLISSVIEKKKAQLEEYDQLAQSIFYDMFGDPVTNEKGWEEEQMGHICTITSSKRIFANEYCEEGIPFYRGKEITELSKGLPISIELKISQERYEEIKSEYGIPSIGDILITAVGTIGNIWVVNDESPFYFKDGNIIWLKDIEGFNSIFFKKLLSLQIEAYKYEMAQGCAYNALTIVNLKKMKALCPPLSLQQQFAEKIEAIERQKELIKQSIAETETLFNSRMDYYFN